MRFNFWVGAWVIIRRKSVDWVDVGNRRRRVRSKGKGGMDEGGGKGECIPSNWLLCAPLHLLKVVDTCISGALFLFFNNIYGFRLFFFLKKKLGLWLINSLSFLIFLLFYLKRRVYSSFHMVLLRKWKKILSAAKFSI